MNETRDIDYDLKVVDLTFGALIAICLITLQVLISLNTLDTPTLISLIALALAIPLSALMLLINFEEKMKKRKFEGIYDTIKQAIGTTAGLSAIVGVDSAIWHTSWIAGVVFLFASVIALSLYFVFWRKFAFLVE